jgi:hypothetical protein
VAALARIGRITATSASPAIPPAFFSPAPISMLQMSCRGSGRSHVHGQSAELASHDYDASEGASVGLGFGTRTCAMRTSNALPFATSRIIL